MNDPLKNNFVLNTTVKSLQKGRTMTDVNKILASIEKVANSERVTKTELSYLSRELLTYIVVDGSNDIGLVNRLINVLTPQNKRTCIIFFAHFLPFQMHNEDGTFGKKMKGEKLLKSKKDACEEFLANPDSDVWTWAALNVKIEKKPVDFRAKIIKDVSKAMSEDDPETRLTAADVIAAVIEGGVTVEDLFFAVEADTKKEVA